MIRFNPIQKASALGARRLLTIAAGVSMALLAGCNADNRNARNSRPTPLVNPTNRDLNSQAMGETNRQLAQTQWAILESRGPKPRGTIGSHGPGGVMNDDSPFMLKGALSMPNPTTGPTSRPTLNEADLPVTVVTQPDGKVKIIWVLRSYGGSNVAVARDVGTNRRQVTLTPPDLTPLVTVLSQTVGAAGSVVPLPAVNTIVVTCDPTQRQSVLQTLNDIDRPAQQVEITVKVFEVSQDFDYQQGARLMAKRIGDKSSQQGFSTFDTQKFQQATANPAAGPMQGSVVSLMQASSEAGLSLEASFQLMAEMGLIKVVSSPRMVVAVGQTGYTLAGQEIPIQSANIVNNVLQTTTQYKPVGVQLYITPQALGGDLVKLHTMSIVSSIDGFQQLPTVSGQVDLSRSLINPVIVSREAETEVTIRDGSTLVISGLRMIRTMSRENKVPGLGDVPLLGNMFKNHHSQQQMTDLYFFVTPSIL